MMSMHCGLISVDTADSLKSLVGWQIGRSSGDVKSSEDRSEMYPFSSADLPHEWKSLVVSNRLSDP